MKFSFISRMSWIEWAHVARGQDVLASAKLESSLSSQHPIQSAPMCDLPRCYSKPAEKMVSDIDSAQRALTSCHGDPACHLHILCHALCHSPSSDSHAYMQPWACYVHQTAWHGVPHLPGKRVANPAVDTQRVPCSEHAISTRMQVWWRADQQAAGT